MKQKDSWIELPSDSDFSIHNIPFGIFSSAGRSRRIGIAIGDMVLDLKGLADLGYFDKLQCDKTVFSRDKLNDFIALGKDVTGKVRRIIQSLLRDFKSTLRDDAQLFVNQSDATMHMPVNVPDYTDFYSSIEHATNVGMLFRDPANALLPNWRHLPVGYHGRASSIVVSGTNIHRPKGQTKPNDGPPEFGPSKRLDFELEMAFIVAKETSLGTSVAIDEAEEYIFGLVLFNDWSARDIQKWEYVPLGPFLGKSFASSVSPWIVTLEAIDFLRVDGPVQEPEVLAYLRYNGPKNFDINLEVRLASESGSEQVVSRSNYKYMYWNMAQQLAHHTVNGCNLNVGDMMASGTISGKSPDSYGSMLEISKGGKIPIILNDNTERRFIEDGDTITLRGHGYKDDKRVGFGEVTTKILPTK